jgi:hypothetical protein
LSTGLGAAVGLWASLGTTLWESWACLWRPVDKSRAQGVFGPIRRSFAGDRAGGLWVSGLRTTAPFRRDRRPLVDGSAGRRLSSFTRSIRSRGCRSRCCGPIGSPKQPRLIARASPCRPIDLSEPLPSETRSSPCRPIRLGRIAAVRVVAVRQARASRCRASRSRAGRCRASGPRWARKFDYTSKSVYSAA